MSSHDETLQVPASPAGEEIQLPSATPLPLIAGVSITLIVVGSTFSWIVSGFGGVLLAWAAKRWISDSRESLHALPEPASSDHE